MNVSVGNRSQFGRLGSKTPPRRIDFARQDRLLDEALDQTFPASDPISPISPSSFD